MNNYGGKVLASPHVLKLVQVMLYIQLRLLYDKKQGKAAAAAPRTSRSGRPSQRSAAAGSEPAQVCRLVCARGHVLLTSLASVASSLWQLCCSCAMLCHVMSRRVGFIVAVAAAHAQVPAHHELLLPLLGMECLKGGACCFRDLTCRCAPCTLVELLSCVWCWPPQAQ